MIQKASCSILLLFNPQNFWSSLLRGLLLLVPPVERRSRSVISANVVKILDLVDSDDPVLAGEGFLDAVQSWADIWKFDASDPILGLPGWEE
jgi:hypothetical protein